MNKIHLEFKEIYENIFENVKLKKMSDLKKLIDIKSKDVEPLKILAVKANKDLKNYIQDVLSEHVLKAKK